MSDHASPGDVVELACRDVGPVDGAPLVLLHGAGAESSCWDAVCWPDPWRTLRVDLRGHGESPWAHDYGLPAMAQDVRAVMDKLSVEQADLVGHSMGAMVAYIMAQRSPERVRRMVLVEPPPPLPAWPPRDEGPKPTKSLDYDWSFQAAFTSARNHPDPGWWDDLVNITAPTLILAGTHGSYDPAQHAAMQARIPCCRIVQVPTGHHVHDERPEEFVTALARFLGR